MQAGGSGKESLEAVVRWLADTPSGGDVGVSLKQWLAPDVVVEAENALNVPWRGSFEGLSAATAFFLRLRTGLFYPTAANALTKTGLQWTTAATGPDGFVVRWEPSQAAGDAKDDAIASSGVDVDSQGSAKQRRAECGAWLIGKTSAAGDGRLARLGVHHTHPLACSAAFRTRAQRAFDEAFAHFFRMDYAAFRQSFDPDVTITWHGDAPLGKVFHGNQEGLSEYIRTRVQIFLQTSVEFEPILADETSASYHVVFRPLTIRATEEAFEEVRGLQVIRVNEAGLIDEYQMTILDQRVNAALTRSVKE